MRFKNQYYYFVSGLPEITFDSTKLPFTIIEFRTMLEEVLVPSDKKLIDKHFLKFDNENLLRFLKDKDAQFDELGTLSATEFSKKIDDISVDYHGNKSRIPIYQEEFIRKWFDNTAQKENKLWEDCITSLYMDYGTTVKDSLVAKWFELNSNIGNILSAMYAKKYNIDVAKVIVGNNEVAKTIRENVNQRDLGLSQLIDYFEQILHLTEETDIYGRERKIDKFRWNWLDEQTVFNYFDIGYIFAYLCKLQILERWVNLNAEEGERIFRQLIQGLKNNVSIPQE